MEKTSKIDVIVHTSASEVRETHAMVSQNKEYALIEIENSHTGKIMNLFFGTKKAAITNPM